MSEGNSAPESVIANPEVIEPSSPTEKSASAIERRIAGLSTKQKLIRAFAAPLAALGLFSGATASAEAASPAQNMVSGTEKVLDRGSQMANDQLNIQMEPGQKMADATLDIKSKDFAGSQERVQDSPPQNMVTEAESIRQEPGEKMADSTENVRKDFAAGQERIQDKGSDMAHKQEAVRMEPGAQMAADQEDTTSKDFAGNAERVQDEDGSGGDDSNTETPKPEIPPADEALV